MTDARFPERWLNDRRLQSVAPSTFRVFANSLMWAVGNRTDGHIPADAVPLIPHASVAEMGALAMASLLMPDMDGDGWRIVDYEDTQTSAAQLEAAAIARRANDRERQERHRKTLLSRDRSRDNPRDNTRPGQARTGQAPNGQQPLTDVHTREACLGCDRPARNGCRTCWDHAHLETAQP
jgi:hypothetical protein